MTKYSIILIILALLVINTNTWSQEESESTIELSRKIFGINLGTGFFQHVNLDLVNFNQQILTTSDNLIPINFKASFSYYFIPNLAIRFSSGYGYTQQKNQNNIDYSKIYLKDIIAKDESTFSVTGFPAEVTMLFQTPIDVRANSFLHFGIGFGYYIYNYKAEGTVAELNSETNTKKLEENYVNPEINLAGAAQFFVLGFDIKLGSQVGATLEFSKIGWSSMKLTRDITSQQIEAGEVEYEYKYGLWQQDYAVKNGFNDMAVSLGLFWQL